MKSIESSSNTLDEHAAILLAKSVKREVDLREIFEQTASQFYLGYSVGSAILRVFVVLAFGYLYMQVSDTPSLSMWPIVALAALVETIRANRRLNALRDLKDLSNRNQSEQIVASNALRPE